MKLDKLKSGSPPSSQLFRAVFRCARNRVALWLFCLALMLAGAATGRAQSALDGFDPNANGLVRAFVVQSDGKILLGGEFTTLSPNGGVAVTRNRIARLNTDGSLDIAFDPNVSGGVNTSVNVIAVQPDGKILIGGDFTTLVPNNGAVVTRNRIARLNENGSLDTNFNPNANGIVSSMALQTDGKILVGGEFYGANSIGGQTRNRMARLDATTGAADSFDPDAGGFSAFNPSVSAIAVQTDGRILVGGGFSAIGGQSRNRIARLDPVTGAADSFNPDAGTSFGTTVQELIVQADGKILVGGGFGSIGGQPRSCVARLDPITGAADAWNPNANNTVYAMVMQPDGKVLIGGDFDVVSGVTTFMARLHPVTGAAEAFNPGANERVFSIALQSDGKILAGGGFGIIGGQPRRCIARLQIDGRLDRTIDLNLTAFRNVWATAVQPDGKVLIGGEFSSVLGVTRNRIARLNTDGTLDIAFDPNAISTSFSAKIYSIAVLDNGKILAAGAFDKIGGQTRFGIARLDATTGAADTFNSNSNGSIVPVTVQADGKIIVSGSFTSIGGQARARIARLNPDGTADLNFNPNANDVAYSIVVQADGRVLVGGKFTSIGGQPRNHIARLDATTGAPDSFNPSANKDVWSIALETDGMILVGGEFSGSNSIGGETRNFMARLDPNTGLADAFNPNASGPSANPLLGSIYSIALQADGRILAGGSFYQIGGQPRNCIARLYAASALADSFNPNASYSVPSVTVQADGKILAGGDFATIGGQTRQSFARLSNDTAAQQNVAVTQTSVIWTRGGSSPQFARVTFESSTTLGGYSPLGQGTASGNNWCLTGLNLPTGQNLNIRARDYYRSGSANSSQSIQESVKNVFLTPLPAQITSIARLAGGAVELRGFGTPNGTHPLQASTDLAPLSFMSIGNVTPDELGYWLFLDMGASGQPRRFYRLAIP